VETQFTTSIWGDEGFSAILSMKSPMEIIQILMRDTSPPLWNFSEYLAFQVFGTSEIVIRGLAFFYYLIAIFFVYKIGTHFWSRKTGALAALLTFFNPFFFIYAFEGRMYSILAAGVTASMYFFLKILRGEGNPKMTTKVGYVVATLWALYSHHFAIFALFVQGLWFLWELALGNRKVAGVLFKLFIITGIGYIPWMIPLYNQTKMVGGGFWLSTPTPDDLKILIYDYLSKGIKSFDFDIPILNLKYYDLALYMIYATLVLRKWHKGIKKTSFLLTWFLLPILMTWLVSQYFTSIFYNRYLLYAIPGAMLIVGSQTRKLSLIPIAGTLVLFLIIDGYYFTHPVKLPFRELALYVQENQMPEDARLNWNSNGAHHLWETKYYGIDAPIYSSSDGDLPFFVGTALMEEHDVTREIPDANRIAVITSGEVEEVYLEGYELFDYKDFSGAKVVWMERE
jgi:4-amino-4-deoxy-L-arabinose transferase-like glycosyltransferase